MIRMNRHTFRVAQAVKAELEQLPGCSMSGVRGGGCSVMGSLQGFGQSCRDYVRRTSHKVRACTF